MISLSALSKFDNGVQELEVAAVRDCQIQLPNLAEFMISSSMAATTTDFEA